MGSLLAIRCCDNWWAHNVANSNSLFYLSRQEEVIMKNLNDLTAVLEQLTPLERDQIDRAKSSYMLHVAQVTMEYIQQKEELDNFELLVAPDDAISQQTLLLIRQQVAEMESKMTQLSCELENHFGISA